MAQLTQLRAWWQSLPLPWRKWRVVGCVDAGDEIPADLPHRGVVLVGTKRRPTWAALDCPCRTGHRLMVNLDSRRPPHWKIAIKPRLSLRPSIDTVMEGRRCHFVLHNGRIRWARDAQRVRG